MPNREGDDLIDYGNAPEIFIDDWCEPVIRNGILTNTAYRIINGQKVVVLRIVQPACTIQGTIDRVNKVVRENMRNVAPPTHAFEIFSKVRGKILS